MSNTVESHAKCSEVGCDFMVLVALYNNALCVLWSAVKKLGFASDYKSKVQFDICPIQT